MLRKSTKINRKIRKALVYYRTRTRENRKIAPSWDSMGLGKWKESNGQLEIRNHIHRIFRKWKNSQLYYKIHAKNWRKAPKIQRKGALFGRNRIRILSFTLLYSVILPFSSLTSSAVYRDWETDRKSVV